MKWSHLLNNDELFIMIFVIHQGLEGSREVLGVSRRPFEKCWLEVRWSWLMLELCCDIIGSKMAAKIAI